MVLPWYNNKSFSRSLSLSSNSPRSSLANVHDSNRKQQTAAGNQYAYIHHFFTELTSLLTPGMATLVYDFGHIFGIQHPHPENNKRKWTKSGIPCRFCGQNRVYERLRRKRGANCTEKTAPNRRFSLRAPRPGRVSSRHLKETHTLIIWSNRAAKNILLTVVYPKLSIKPPGIPDAS